MNTLEIVQTIKDTLPNKLSELIEVALKDLAACEADKHVNIDMSSWFAVYDHNDNSVCYVCLAGAVMRETLKIEEKIGIPDRPHIDIGPSRFIEPIDKKLKALNQIRTGEIGAALRVVHNFDFEKAFLIEVAILKKYANLIGVEFIFAEKKSPTDFIYLVPDYNPDDRLFQEYLQFVANELKALDL